VLALHNRTPGLLKRLGLTRAQVDQSVWAVEPGGAKLGGPAAANRVFQELTGPWPLVARAYRFPVGRVLEDSLYRWVARNRHRLGRFWSDPPET
jgi:predicted DCC family thiol-disulfide oxidoreductase YuxK